MSAEQIVFFLVFGAVGLVNMLMRKDGVKKGSRRAIGTGTAPAPGTRSSQVQPTDEDERLRKFMEALGVPASAAPVRKIVRPQPQPQPVVVHPAARAQTTPVRRQAVPRKVAAPVPAPVRVESSYQTETVGTTQVAKIDYEMPTQAAPVASLAAASRATGHGGIASVDFRALLRSPSSIRTAMVLKEILGTPRGLQPFEGAYSQR